MSSPFINLTDPVVFQSFGGDEYWTKVDFPAGSTILKEGEDSQDFFYIFSGSVEITTAMKLLATLGAGDFFGEAALLSDKERNATVTAVSDTVVLKLSQPKFEALVLKDAQAAVGILLGIVKVLNGRLQDRK
ncbi:MAG: cyclic nucleotide-binding domain-containing protein [Candidatus Gracilibacteria bacterium]|jgi:CRP-like cAMP-binding protein